MCERDVCICVLTSCMYVCDSKHGLPGVFLEFRKQAWACLASKLSFQTRSLLWLTAKCVQANGPERIRCLSCPCLSPHLPVAAFLYYRYIHHCVCYLNVL